MLRPGEATTSEPDIALLWTKFATIAALAETCKTIPGVRGYIANASSLGVRVETQHLALARQALQLPSAKISAINQNIAGKFTYALQGFAVGTSAKAVTEMMNTTRDESKWKPWVIIPTRHVPASNHCTWHCKADIEPSLTRVILDDGRKVTITPIPSRHEQWKQNLEEKQAKADQDKEARRQKLVAGQESDPDPWHHDDPWRAWTPSKGKSKGKGKQSKPSKGEATSSSDPAHASQIQQLRKDVDNLTSRMDQQDHTINQLQFQITGNHQEIMAAFRSLGAGAGSSPEPTRASGKKRQPEIGHTPLKALAERSSEHKK